MAGGAQFDRNSGSGAGAKSRRRIIATGLTLIAIPGADNGSS
jgi:hypothetical protein